MVLLALEKTVKPFAPCHPKFSQSSMVVKCWGCKCVSLPFPTAKVTIFSCEKQRGHMALELNGVASRLHPSVIANLKVEFTGNEIHHAVDIKQKWPHNKLYTNVSIRFLLSEGMQNFSHY